MKKGFRRALLWLLTVALLVPALSTAVGPVIAATTSGSIGNMDPALTENLIAPSEDATVNLGNSGGIRFATNINLEKYAALKAFCKQRRIKGVSVGTLIAPLDYVKEAKEFSTAALDTLDHKTSYLDIKANTEIFYDGEKTLAEGYDEQFVASIMNIKLENRTRDFAAIGYIQLTLLDGNYFTVYSYDNTDMGLVEKYAANLAEVAEAELLKDTWTDEERAMIEDLANTKLQTVGVGETAVTDFRYTRSQAYFTYENAEGQVFYNRITYNGANGWRLQTNTKSYNHFKDTGAGQSLAMYMDEGFNDVEIPLNIVYTEDVPTSGIMIFAQGTDTSVSLDCNSFNLWFENSDHEGLYNVNGMSISEKGEVVLTGKMNATDAVYGGGESFGDSNRRGQDISLYISDAYDAKGTYVAIPLFSTSRGGGMFVNKYDPMNIYFPTMGYAGIWSLTINTEIVDCYFFATGNISDVLQAYTDLTGHASLPEEWAQGYLVCRYAPDFNSLTDINGNTEGVYWRTELPDPASYSYTPHLPLTAEAAQTLGKNAVIQDKTGKTTFYTYIIETNSNNAAIDSNNNGIKGEKYFKSETQSGVYYYSYADLPNKDECYYDDPKKVTLADNPDALCHKKSVTSGGTYYNYVIEDETEDFNYNGITGESYFLRVGTRGGPGGAGTIYIVESLIEAGMRPTGVILEGLQWYNMATEATQWANLKKYIEYLDSQNIKTLVYTSLGYVTGSGMGKNYKNEYKLSINLWGYDAATGEKTDELLAENITNIPKSDRTDNPDTTSDGSQVYLDITNPDAMKWYVDTVWNEMIKLGVDGIKIDFCESVPNQGYYEKVFINKKEMSGYLEYNWHDPSVFENTEIHHAYPSYFVSQFYKAMEEKAAQRDGDTGFVLITRGGGIGAQRNPYLWAGDQSRIFRNLSTQLAAVINSGISGLPFMTYDMGGYAYSGSAYHYYGGQLQTITDSQGSFYLKDLQAAEEYESEIFVRALQFTTFGNMIQTHGYVRHVYQMTEEAQTVAALYNALHEQLADYLQELSQIACDTGMPMIRHMILEYQNDANVANIDDQFMYGDALLVAPILTCATKWENGKMSLDYASTITRTVYLPAGEWIDLNTSETIVSEGETITVSANLAQIPLYLNLESEYAAQMQEIFAGETWQAIVGYANQLDNA